MIFFYYCIEFFFLKLPTNSSTGSKRRIRLMRATISLILLVAPFHIFFRSILVLHITIKWLGLILIFLGFYILNSFLTRLNFRYSFWIILSGAVLISSVFFFILYSPFTFTVINNQKIWNTLPILPLNISFFLSGIMMLIYGYHRASLQQFIA